MLLGNEHAEKALLLDEIPDLFRNLTLLRADLPIVRHPAELFRRTLEEIALILGEAHRTHGAESGPIRLAAEQLGIETQRAGLQGLTLGRRNRRQDLLDHAEGRHGDRLLPERAICERGEHDHRQPGQKLGEADAAHGPEDEARLHGENRNGQSGRPCPKGRAPKRKSHRCSETNKQKDECRHGLPSIAGCWKRLRAPYGI
jgi:hypothetical protein